MKNTRRYLSELIWALVLLSCVHTCYATTIYIPLFKDEARNSEAQIFADKEMKAYPDAKIVYGDALGTPLASENHIIISGHGNYVDKKISWLLNDGTLISKTSKEIAADLDYLGLDKDLSITIEASACKGGCFTQQIINDLKNLDYKISGLAYSENILDEFLSIEELNKVVKAGEIGGFRTRIIYPNEGLNHNTPYRWGVVKDNGYYDLIHENYIRLNYNQDGNLLEEPLNYLKALADPKSTKVDSIHPSFFLNPRNVNAEEMKSLLLLNDAVTYHPEQTLPKGVLFEIRYGTSRRDERDIWRVKYRKNSKGKDVLVIYNDKDTYDSEKRIVGHITAC